MINNYRLISKPRAIKKPKTLRQLGFTRTDDYAWLKDENWQQVMSDPSVLNPEIRDHLLAENTYCDAVLEPTQDLQDKIFAEFRGRIKDDDSSVPAPDGPYAYGHKFRSGDEFGLYYRTPSQDLDARPEILLDADFLAAQAKSSGHGYFQLSDVAHSDDHQYLAYGVDVHGSEIYQIWVQHIESGAFIDAPIEDTTGDFIWAADNQSLLWVERDAHNRPKTVYAQNIITGGPRTLVYDEADPGFFVSIGRTDSGKWIAISAHNHTTSEIRILRADTPFTNPKTIAPRQDGHEYSISDHGDDFYILTNMGGAVDFQIMKTAQANPAQDHWQTFEPYQSGRLILGMETYANHLVWIERINALPRIVIHDLNSGKRHNIAFDEQAYALGLQGGYEYDTPWLRFSYSSPTTPRQIFDYHMDTRERVLRKTTQVPSGHDPKDYKTERIEIIARDGQSVPMTLIMRADFEPDGTAPCLLYGYGSYGITIPAGFRTTLLSLVDRGFVYAIAHIRGGMAKGYDWYLQGKLEHKKNTFFDFIDCARALAAQNYTSSGRIIAHGGSAGGLLVGACLNEDPDLFGGVIAAVPFVDVLNTMSDDSLPLTPPEWPEWGNPLTDTAAYENIASYCPYTNIKAHDYPPVLITAGLTDPRVTYWEPAKWAAKLREHQSGPAPILLKTHMDAGHQGESGRYASLKDLAMEYAFAVTITG